MKLFFIDYYLIIIEDHIHIGAQAFGYTLSTISDHHALPEGQPRSGRSQVPAADGLKFLLLAEGHILAALNVGKGRFS